MPTAQADIVDALRTPTGRRRGGLAHVHAADLGAHAEGGGTANVTIIERLG